MESLYVYDYIEAEIAKIPSDQDPITINEDYRWHELIEEAEHIFYRVLDKFNLENALVITEGNVYRNNDRGRELYYYIEDTVMSKFNIIDE
jgi:hypothetical protein